jgi:acetyl esterase/lipase
MDAEQIAPELRRGARLLSRVPLGSAWMRRILGALARFAPQAKLDGVRLEMLGGSRRPALRIYHPEVRRSDAALLWIHGGGFVMGTTAQDDRLCASTARELGIAVVSVEYRLAPDHPFPAALDDGRAAWAWLRESAATLGVDPRRIAIGGESAGGGLAASLVQRVHDEGGGTAAQWLFCPMLDDRTAARRDLDAIRHWVWNNRLNAMGWRSFLGREPGAADAPRYAVAARRGDLRGLPPAWIGVGDIDLFYAEDREYAERLRAAGVDVTFAAVPAAPHGFEAWAFETKLAQDFIAAAQAWLRQSLR